MSGIDRTQAERMRRMRARQRRGLIQLQLEIEHEATALALIRLGLLAPQDVDDADRVADAVAQIVRAATT